MSPYSCNISFSQRLFLSVMSLFLLFVICFVAYQYHREKAYKIELLNTKLQDYNRQMEESFSDYDELNDSLIENFLHHHYIKDLQLPRRSLIVSVIRGGEEIIPKGDTKLISGDRIIVLVDAFHLDETKLMLESVFTS